MAVDRRTTVNFDGPAAENLEFVESELGLNTSDCIRKALALMALVIRRQNDGCTPAFVQIDGTVQEIVLL